MARHFSGCVEQIPLSKGCTIEIEIEKHERYDAIYERGGVYDAGVESNHILIRGVDILISYFDKFIAQLSSQSTLNLVPFSYQPYQEIARAPARDSEAISALTSTGTHFRIPTHLMGYLKELNGALGEVR